ncbi:MAG: hypothetical protein LBP23_08595 [Treponema sp.]|jgi:hypothetical protein|nr:hypothetical protein [Treponema sp.]
MVLETVGEIKGMGGAADNGIVKRFAVLDKSLARVVSRFKILFIPIAVILTIPGKIFRWLGGNRDASDGDSSDGGFEFW